MEVRQFTKRPLTVDAFQFDAAHAEILTAGESCQFEIGGAKLKRIEGLSSTRYAVWNPGRASSSEPWQDVKHGDYVIIAPTGCRYPVQADQFERNYAEAVQGSPVREVA